MTRFGRLFHTSTTTASAAAASVPTLLPSAGHRLARPSTGPAAVAAAITSGSHVFIHGTSAFPQHLVDCMVGLVDDQQQRGAATLRNVELCHIHVEGNTSYSLPQYAHAFHTTNFFVGANQRAAVAQGTSDAVPIFLSEIAQLFRPQQHNVPPRFPVDVALVSVSPPDKHGYCSLGTSVDIAVEAVQHAQVVIAQVNAHMPRTHGSGLIHTSNIDYLVRHDAPLPVTNSGAPHGVDTVVQRIGANVASLIEDGSTLQMGIGNIPDAVLASLTGHKNLGIHTEMFANGVVDLVRRGVVTNSLKKVAPGHIVASFLCGNKELYDFVDDNPLIRMAPASFVNDPAIIKQNPRVVAINSAVEIDLTGQVCADSAGTRVISGVGGQMVPE